MATALQAQEGLVVAERAAKLHVVVVEPKACRTAVARTLWASQVRPFAVETEAGGRTWLTFVF
jgi:hypothetical protein